MGRAICVLLANGWGGGALAHKRYVQLRVCMATVGTASSSGQTLIRDLADGAPQIVHCAALADFRHVAVGFEASYRCSFLRTAMLLSISLTTCLTVLMH